MTYTINYEIKSRQKSKNGKTIFERYILFIYFLFFIASVVNSPFFESISYLRYFNYLIPAIILLLWNIFPSRRSSFDTKNFAFFSLMGFSLMIPLIMGGLNSAKYVVFITLGFFVYCFPLRLDDRLLKILFLFFSLAQLILFFASGSSIRTLDLESYASGSAAATHTLPVFFGIFFGYFLVSKQYKLTFICAILIFLSGKRSVLLASMVGLSALSLYLLVLYDHVKRASIIKFVIYSSIFVGYSLFSLKLPSLFELASQEFGLNIDVLTSGRYIGQQYAYASLNNADLPTLIFGQGLGRADQYAYDGFFGLASLIHSDYLRIFVDLGILGGAIFAAAYISLIGRDKLGFYFVVFSLHLWVTENNVINVSVPLLMYFCIHSLPSSIYVRRMKQS